MSRGGGLEDDVFCVDDDAVVNPLLLEGIDIPGEESAARQMSGAIQCPRVRGSIDGTAYNAASTCGDGACALHAVWGKAEPSRHMELYAEAVRARVLAEVPENALAVSGLRGGRLRDQFVTHMDSVWKDLVSPAARAWINAAPSPSREAGIACG